jgi:hypothetical protein
LSSGDRVLVNFVKAVMIASTDGVVSFMIFSFLFVVY